MQSLTLARVAICWYDMPSHGQLYVAMSRVKKASDLFFYGVDANNVNECLRLYLNCDAIEIVRNEIAIA